MKVLLDENIPHPMRHHLPGHEVYTTLFMEWAGIKNGHLLDAAEAANFAVLVTGDQTLSYEQNMSHRRIAIVSLSAISWPVIELHIGRIAAVVDNAKPGSFTRVECGQFSRRRSNPGPHRRMKDQGFVG